MEISTETVDQVCVIDLVGRLEASNSAQLKDKVSELIKDGQVNLLVDMSRIDFIDSSGLGTLVKCLRSASKAGGGLKITSLQEYTRKLFTTTRLDRVFELFKTRDAALKSFH